MRIKTVYQLFVWLHLITHLDSLNLAFCSESLLDSFYCKPHFNQNHHFEAINHCTAAFSFCRCFSQNAWVKENYTKLDTMIQHAWRHQIVHGAVYPTRQFPAIPFSHWTYAPFSRAPTVIKNIHTGSGLTPSSWKKKYIFVYQDVH